MDYLLIFIIPCLLQLFSKTLESSVSKISSNVGKRKRKTSDTQIIPPSAGMVVLYIIYISLEMIILVGYIKVE